MAKYRTLKSLFHENESIFKQKYTERFNGENTLKFSFDIKGLPAFAVLTPEMIIRGDSIRKMQIRLERLEATIPCKPFILMDSVFQEIEQSNEIEGVHSSRRDLENALNAKPGTRFAGQMEQYFRLLSGEVKFPDNPLDVRQLYNEMLLQDVVSEHPENRPDGRVFRADTVGVVDGTRTIHNGIMPESMIISMMEQALELVRNENYPFLVRAAVFHFMFGYIHPFYDGNGRLNRFLTSMLISEELSILSSLQLSLSFRKNRRQYYKAFEASENPLNKGDLTPFILMFLEILESALKHEIVKLESQLEKYEQYLSKLNDTSLKPAEKTFLETLLAVSLFSLYGISKQQMIQITQMSQSWVDKTLKKHRDKLNVRREGHAKWYSMNKEFLATLV